MAERKPKPASKQPETPDKPGRDYVLNLNNIQEMFTAKPSRANEYADSLIVFYEDETSALRWFGVPTKASLDTAIFQGWPEGVKRAQKITDGLELSVPVIKSLRRKTRYGAEGDEICVERYLQKDFDHCFAERVKIDGRSTKGKIVTITVNLAYGCKRTTDEAFYRGAVTSLLTDTLENAGYRVEIVGKISIEHPFVDIRNANGKIFITIPIKSSNEPMDINRLIALTGLAGAFRYYGFKLITTAPEAVINSLGAAISSAPYAIDGDNIVIGDIWDKQTAIDALNGILGEF